MEKPNAIKKFSTAISSGGVHFPTPPKPTRTITGRRAKVEDPRSIWKNETRTIIHEGSFSVNRTGWWQTIVGLSKPTPSLLPH
ncbi:hypothetical protein DSECCO2_363640 [anaerobic digester metagenome]